MNIDELHNKLAEKDWLIEDLTEVDFLLIAHVKEIMEEQLAIQRVVDTLVCDHCDSDNITEKQRPEYECNDCKERF